MSDSGRKIRLGILASHPIQYQAPIFRELAMHVDLVVFFAHRQTPQGQAAAGFGIAFEWDSDLLAGYAHEFLENISGNPGTDRFLGCNTPGISAAISNDRFDCFLVMGWNLLSYWQAVRACRRQHVPVMQRGDSQLNTPGSVFKAMLKRLLYPWMLGRFDAHLYVGRNNKAYLQHYGVGEERLYFSPHCVSAEQFAGAAGKQEQGDLKAGFGENPATRVVLFCGRMVEFKRAGDLIEALAMPALRGQDMVVWLAGDGPMREALGKLAAERGVKARFLGFRNQSQLPAIYTAADVLVLPSSGQETWGLVVNEALLCGTAVVVSDKAGCAPDMVLPGETGFTFPCGDVPAMANAISNALAISPASPAINAVNRAYSVENAAQGIMGAARNLVRISGNED